MLKIKWSKFANIVLYNRLLAPGGGGLYTMDLGGSKWLLLTTRGGIGYDMNGRSQMQGGKKCAGNLSPAMGARNQVGIGLSYRPASLCSLATQFQNRFLESIPCPIAGLKIPTPDFADKWKPVLLRLSLAGNLEKPLTYIPLWDRIEGTWPWTMTICRNPCMIIKFSPLNVYNNNT